MAEIEPGRQAVTQVRLRPIIEWKGDAPTAEHLSQMHEKAHEECYIANSVKTEVIVEQA